MAVQTKGTMFPVEVVSEMFNKVKGHSTIAKLSGQTPLSFNGNQIFTFAMDKEVDIVAEGAKKSEGGITVEPVTMAPIKIEYGARVTDEFLYASEEEQLNILKAFAEGYAKKVARGLDLMAFHGVNPRTGDSSALIGTNCIDSASKTSTLNSDPEEGLETVIEALGDADVTGYAFSKKFGSGLGKMKVNGVKQYPEFALGGNPDAFNGIACDVNSTVEENGGEGTAYVGDFANAFKWGYAKEIGVEVIPYGDPDNTGVDLKGSNQVYLRAETYIGWGILDGASFGKVSLG